MARLQRKRFTEAVDVREFPRGKVEVVELDDVVVGRMSYQPGWRWSVDVKPIAGTDRCQYHHLGITLSGRVRAEMVDGTELEEGFVAVADGFGAGRIEEWKFVDGTEIECE